MRASSRRRTLVARARPRGRRGGLGGARGGALSRDTRRAQVRLCVAAAACRAAALRAGWQARAADRVLRTRPRGHFEPRFWHTDRARHSQEGLAYRARDFTLSMYHFYRPNRLKEDNPENALARE